MRSVASRGQVRAGKGVLLEVGCCGEGEGARLRRPQRRADELAPAALVARRQEQRASLGMQVGELADKLVDVPVRGEVGVSTSRQAGSPRRAAGGGAAHERDVHMHVLVRGCGGQRGGGGCWVALVGVGVGVKVLWLESGRAMAGARAA